MDEKKKNGSPMVVIGIIVVICVLLLAVCIIGITKILPKGNSGEDDSLEGHMTLVNEEENVYTFVDANGKVKKYKNYTDMNDFYYDVTCVSRISNESEFYSQDALINKNEKVIVDYGVYDDITQVSNGRYYKVEKDDVYGIINYEGKVIVPVEYSYITVKTVRNEAETVFVGEKEDQEYYYINENGKVITQTDYGFFGDLSYYDKFNDEYDTVIVVSTKTDSRYFNLRTGEEIFQGIKDVKFWYNMLKQDKKVVLYNKDMSVKSEIDTSSDNSVSINNYYGAYSVLEEKKVENKKRIYQYTVFDSELNAVKTSDAEIRILKDDKENYYFIENKNNSAVITVASSGEEKIIENHIYSGGNNVASSFIMLKRSDGALYDVYDFGGNIVLEGVTNYRYAAPLYVITKGTEQSLLTASKQEVPLNKNDNIIVKDEYIIIENSSDKTIKLIDKEGKVIIDTIQGTRYKENEQYLSVKVDEKYEIYNTKNGKKTFEYTADNFVRDYEDVNVVKLKDGCYTYEGKKI